MNRSWMIHYAVWLHLLWGSLLLFTPSPLNVTAVHSMAYTPHHTIMGMILIGVAIMAWLGADYSMRGTMKGLFFILPQQAVLMLSAYGAIVAISNSTFADGVVRPRAFIAADQFPAILAGVMHTLALIDLHFGKAWER